MDNTLIGVTSFMDSDLGSVLVQLLITSLELKGFADEFLR